jgi:hypothetical protein
MQICVVICFGTNGESYFNTAALVACVRNFSENRGPIVGILKGFAGLSGAIFTQIYTATVAPEQSSLILMVAVIPAVVAILVMFVLRHVPSDGQNLAAQSQNFRFLYGVCLALAAYLFATILIQDMAHVSYAVSVAFACGLLFLLSLPLLLPFKAAFGQQFAVSSLEVPIPEPTSDKDIEALQAPLLGQDGIHSIPEDQVDEGATTGSASNGSKDILLGLKSHLTAAAMKEQSYKDDVLFSELEDEKETWPENVRQIQLERASSRLFRAVAEGAVKFKRRRGPRRGEDFTMKQAAVKADFWLLFFGLVCGAGSGLMVIDNLGQISQSLGYANPHIFVSMISIWNFLGRLGGGYVSEIIARKYLLPRPILIAAAQAGMALGHVLLAIDCPGSLYIGSLLVGLGYGSHWSVIPATASELFGLKSFGILYNVLCVANPVGSLVFSGLIAGTLYDREAQKQRGLNILANSVANHQLATTVDDALLCEGAICFQETLFIMTGACLLGIVLNLVLVARTRPVYITLYGKQREEDRRADIQKLKGPSSVQKG